ncbi:serine protease inhibitor 3/4-like isoform X3 [Plodia interpunctella]|uniref:serine protease inhibitor 3/4-like isoform X3 n=1 Tax=Plodia interpunctella TaxID=58824 RepID=UPI0023685F14|nr:serine protease inhibitor 3/4-like isoform X3 [Plodia interpunctella]
MDQTALSAAVAKFSAKFCNELEKNKSVVSSPLSAEFVLALLTLGATEPTLTEILKALGIKNEKLIRGSFSKVTSKLKSLKGITLDVANKVYIMEGKYDLKPELKKDAIEVFDAELEKIDFKKSTDAAKRINSWVEEKTNNKIKDLLPPDCFDALTRLVLVNALYFKGTWKTQFSLKNTTKLPFHINAATTVDVPMMYQEEKFYYKESSDLNAQLGIKQIFNKEYSGLTKILNEEEPLYVSKAIQKAFIEVNEEGAEAAAATAVKKKKKSKKNKVLKHQAVVADHPFLAIVVVKKKRRCCKRGLKPFTLFWSIFRGRKQSCVTKAYCCFRRGFKRKNHGSTYCTRQYPKCKAKRPKGSSRKRSSIRQSIKRSSKRLAKR